MFKLFKVWGRSTPYRAFLHCFRGRRSYFSRGRPLIDHQNAIPTRFYIGVMMFTACWVSYMMRVNISLNILEMVNVESHTSNNSMDSICIQKNLNSFENFNDTNHVEVKPIIHEEGPVKFDWTVKQQGLVLGSYFWGYLILSLFGGFFADMYGPRIIVGVSVFLSGIFTLFSPQAASLGYETMIAFRFLIGCLGGVVYPSLHSLVANWAPPEEKGKFIGALLGGTFGTVVTWSFCGFIISYLGWEWAFYIPGIVTILWSGIWFLVVSNSPSDHPRILQKEKDYILERIGNKMTQKKAFPPMKDILLSVPFWAFTVLHFGSTWGLYFQMTSGPKFIAQVLGFDITKAGILASLPYLSRVLMGFVFGSIGDILMKKEKISVTMIRKVFVIFSHFIPGVLLIALTFVGCDQVLSVAILTASLGVNGAATLTNLHNHQDLSPNYVGTLYSIANFLASATGFITPLITAHFTKERNGVEEWRIIFLIGAGVYCIAGVFFVIFGSGNVQYWNDKTSTTKNVDKKNTEECSAKPKTEISSVN